MTPIVLNGFEVSCYNNYSDLIDKPLYAIYTRNEIKPRRIFDNITDVWNYCYSQKRGDEIGNN